MNIAKRVLGASAIVGMVVSLGACSSPSSPGTAVESLGVRYTESDVTVATDELGDLFGQPMSRLTIVQVLAMTQPFIDIAQMVGIDRDSPEIEQLVAGYVEEFGKSPSELSAVTLDAITAEVISMEVAPVLSSPGVDELLVAAMSAPNTVINPRYGEFTAEESFVPAGPLADVVPLSTPGT